MLLCEHLGNHKAWLVFLRKITQASSRTHEVSLPLAWRSSLERTHSFSQLVTSPTAVDDGIDKEFPCCPKYLCTHRPTRTIERHTLKGLITIFFFAPAELPAFPEEKLPLPCLPIILNRSR